MAWLAVNRNKQELILSEEPKRYRMGFYGGQWEGNSIELPKGTIQKLIGSDLTWDDEPVILNIVEVE